MWEGAQLENMLENSVAFIVHKYNYGKIEHEKAKFEEANIGAKKFVSNWLINTFTKKSAVH